MQTPGKLGIALNLAQENALGHDLDNSFRRHLVVETRAQTDNGAERFAGLTGEVSGDGSSSQATRLNQHNAMARIGSALH